jgi:hypothetical protein
MISATRLSCLERFQYSKARKRSFLALPHDVLRHIGLHLKPRHLYKLMVASKRLLRVVDCNVYWERAAAHAVLRHIYSMEIEPGPNQICRFARRRGLFNLVNVDYCKSIDCVIQRARRIMGDHLNVAELVRAGEAIILMDPDNYCSIHAAFAHGAATMKEVVKRETFRVLAEQSSVGHKVRKFQRELDDDGGLSGAAKTYFMRKLGVLLTDVAEHDMIDTELYLFAHMAGDFE